MRRALDEVEKRLAVAARGLDRAQVAIRKRYMRPRLPFLGLTVPAQRAVFATGFEFSDFPREEQGAIWDYIWRHARTHEGKMQPMYFIQSVRKKSEPHRLWELVGGWADDIHCWDHSDELSKVYSYLLEDDFQMVYPSLVEWNSDADAWKRRQSVVSLFCYAQLHERHPPVAKVLPLIRRLLADQDYYVQKGVGWTVRETYNVYPQRAYAFVLRHAAAIHPAAFSAALEKMSDAEKASIKEKRKRER